MNTLIFVCLSIVGFVSAQRFGQVHQQVHQHPDAILRQSSDILDNGQYNYAYETGNGIVAHESGVGGQSVEGAARWVAPDGTPVEFSYTADANGYHPVGSAIPVAPPVPEAIARALLWIAAHPYDEAAHNARELARSRSTGGAVYHAATPARSTLPAYKPVVQPVFRQQPAKPVYNQYQQNQYRRF